MIISDLAVKKRISILVMLVAIVIFGFISYKSMPREAAPDINIPYVFVSTSYPGVSPSDIETAITIPIEKKLKGLEHVKEISSISSEGISSIVIEFYTGTDIDVVLPKVKDKVDLARKDLPTDLDDDPEVLEVNISEMPVLVLSLSGTVGLARLKDIADDLQDDIESIPGVLEAEISGGLEREIRVEPFADKLAYYGIAITSLQSVIDQENKNVSGGAIRMGDGRFQLRVPGEFRSPEEIYNLVVGLQNGEPVYLKDVAQVVDGYKEVESISRLDGRSAVNISVKKRSGENIIRIIDQVNEVLAERESTWPAGTRITKLMDMSEDIRSMIADLENNIMTGLILVAVVLFFVLGIRNAIIVALAIPFSMLTSFLVLNALGITLNMVVLFGLTLSLGMLVDNAIVIIENIYRYMEQGVPKIRAAMKATGEVALPVIGSTATTVGAFFPLLFWPGIMGEFMGYIPLTLIVTLCSSLFVALVINPALAAFFLKLPYGHPARKMKIGPEEVEAAGERPKEAKGPFMRGYRRLLGGALNNRLVVLILAFLVLVVMVEVWFLNVGLEKPIEFFPSPDPNSIYVSLNMPEGADLEYSDRLTRQAEGAICGGLGQRLAPPDFKPDDCYSANKDKKTFTLAQGQKVVGITDLPNIEHIYSRAVSVAGGESLFQDYSPNHLGVQFYDFVDRIEPSTKTMKEIRERVANIPGAEIIITEQQEGPPTGMPINIEISGDNYDVLGSVAGKVRKVLEKIPAVTDIQDDYVSGSPTVRVRVDRQKAALLGLSTEIVGFALKVAFNGLKVSTFHEGDDDYDITVQLPESERRNTDMLRELLMPTATGQLVPLSTVASFEPVGGLGKITRIDHKRTVTVKANVATDVVPGAVARAEAERILGKGDLPPGYTMAFTGEEEEQQEAESFLSKAFLGAILIIVLILVSQFNSVTQPLIIMTSVVLSFGGVFLGLTIMGYPFGVIMTGVGVISLAGVVVNNSIVLIDYTNKLRERGMHTKEAIIGAASTRLRPVLLTAVTTILGLIPMLTGISYDFHEGKFSWISESSQFWSPMAAAVVFGLALATVLTLIVTPTLYSLVYTTGLGARRGVKGLRKAYWAPFYKITGTEPEDDEEE